MKRNSTLLAILVFLLMSSLALQGLTLVGAVGTVDTAAFISVPATAEVGTVVTPEMWVEPAPPNYSVGIYNANVALTITRPSGEVNVYTPMKGENGKLWFTFKVNELGNFTFQFSDSGDGLAYKPSTSQKATLTVTGDSVPPVETDGGSWAKKQSMNRPRGGLGVATVNGKIYAIGGRVENGSYIDRNPTSGFVDTTEEYNPTTDTWTVKASMPFAMSNFAIAVLKNKIYCVGRQIVGWELDEIYHLFQVPIWSSINEVYDTSTDTWEIKTPLPVARSDSKANVVNDTIHVFDGAINWAYDPDSDSWTKKTLASTSVGDSSSAVVGHQIYFFSSYLSVQIYDIFNDSWSQGARAPRMAPEGLAVATTGTSASKRIYLFTVAKYGWVPYGKTDIYPSSRRTTFVYDPEMDHWSAAAVIPSFRSDFAVGVIDDKLYVIGGFVYDEKMRSFTTSGLNEEYLPIDYGTLDKDKTSPSPTLDRDSIAKQMFR